MTSADLVSTNTTDCSAVFQINGERWEYFLGNYHYLTTAVEINKKSGLKALNYVKRRAIRERRLDHAA